MNIIYDNIKKCKFLKMRLVLDNFQESKLEK
jgi:hypothetical protein